MRALNKEELEQRKRKVLQFVIHEFVRTGKPVGSNAIASTIRLDLSSATIRNILVDLEREGMITHPHTSAGRMPTDKGYRAYVDSIIELQKLAVQEQSRIQHEYESRINEVEDLLSQTSHMLSSISHYTGFIMAPKLERNVFSGVDLLPISEHRILVAMVTDSGLTKHFVVNTEVGIPRERLRKIARIISQNFQGHTLQEVQEGMMERLEKAQQEYMEVMSLAKEIGQEIRKFSSGEMYMDGASNILSLPEFSKPDEMHHLFKLIEEKKMLTHLLESEFSQDYGSFVSTKRGSSAKEHLQEKQQKKDSSVKNNVSSRVHVRIGSENLIKEMQNLSVVSSTYQLADRTVGVLGILGPKRMEYPKMIALVDYVSQLVNHFLKDLEKK